MDFDPNAHRGQGGFPVDQPLEALKGDHDFVRQLFDRYLNAPDLNAKKEVGPRLLLLLEMHTSLEDAVFYPRVHEAAPTLVDQCEEDHQQAKQIIERLKGMDEGDSPADQLFRQLADAILKHIDTEEQQLFPKVRQAKLDLTAIGLEMQAFETSMLGTRAQAPQRPGMRQ
jgi:hemerythrin superfamily protein